MRAALFCTLALAGTLAIANEPPQPTLGNAAWIWSADADAPGESLPGTRYFLKTFNIDDRPLKRAFLLITADNRFEAYLNGLQLGAGDDWRVPTRLGLRRHLRPGTNTLAVTATNDGPGTSPAGLIATIHIFYADGAHTALPTGDDWQVASTVPDNWYQPACVNLNTSPATVVALHGDAPWGRLDESDEDARIPDSFPTFAAPQQQCALDVLRDFAYRHYRALRPGATMWDAWLLPPSLWPAVENRATIFRRQWSHALSRRRIDPDGYVDTHQHFSYGHNSGWPFPIWTQAGLDPNGKTLAAGWHFHGPRADMIYQVAIKQLYGGDLVGPQATTGWTLHDLAVEKHDDVGWHLRVTGDNPHITSPATRPFATSNAPYMQIRFRPQQPLAEASPTIGFAWCHEGSDTFTPACRVESPLPAPRGDGWYHHMIRLDRTPNWNGRIARVRFHLPGEPGQVHCVDSVFTVYDTRHPINNSSYVIGICDYFRWTGDCAFLRQNITRARNAMQYYADELGIDKYGVVFVPWVGHDGRSGISYTADGQKRIHFGRGIGNNYFDLLPFGGLDFYATVQFCAAARALASLEDSIATHDDWNIAPPPTDWTANRLRARVERAVRVARDKFWDSNTGRFVGCIDVEGKRWDYGFTFLNLEAIHHNVASQDQAREILDWIRGQRRISGDTSTGEDIYHWRFSPRMTTRRNIEWYTFAWNAPEELDWGDQVQDGGAVLGWSYYDLHARLRVLGPDAAWRRLREIATWYQEVQDAGGYRKYYAVPGRGTLQGGGTAGGLGIDEEFLESALVADFLLDGLLGFRPTPTGFTWHPQLPDALPSLTIDRVAYRDCVLTLTASPDELRIKVIAGNADDIHVEFPPGKWTIHTTPQMADAPDRTIDMRTCLSLCPDTTITIERLP